MGVRRKSRKGRKFHYPSITDNLPKFNDGGKVKEHTYIQTKQLTDELNKYNEVYNYFKEQPNFAKLLSDIPMHKKGSKEYYDTLKEFREKSPELVHPTIDPDFIFPRWHNPLGSNAVYTTRPKEETFTLEKKTFTPEYPQQKGIIKNPFLENKSFSRERRGQEVGGNLYDSEGKKYGLTDYFDKQGKKIGTYDNVKNKIVVEDPVTGLPKFNDGGTPILNKYLKTPISPKGVYDYPKQEVLVPTSGNITMQGVEYPIKGESLQTGETKIVQPDQEYFFSDTNMVKETPILKDGGLCLKTTRTGKKKLTLNN